MDFFFVLSIGRSGTKFLASVLADARGACVKHEPYASDKTLLFLRYAGFNAVADARMEQRFAGIQSEHAGCETYGETNSYLRYEPRWLTENLDAKLLHLVRDGRTYVTSSYQRDVYTPHDIQMPIVPHDDDPHATRWGEMSRFERICWYWNHTNAFLADHVPALCRLEEAVKNYTAFQHKVLEPLDLDVDEASWRKTARYRRNTGIRYRLVQHARAALGRRNRYHAAAIPHWTAWPREKTDIFWSLCGETMRRLGYNE